MEVEVNYLECSSTNQYNTLVEMVIKMNTATTIIVNVGVNYY